MVEYSGLDYVIVQVGEDLPDHFVPGLTAKVLKSGAVYIRESINGDEYWRLDQPETGG